MEFMTKIMAEQAWLFELHLGDLTYAPTSLRWQWLCQNQFNFQPVGVPS
jgi:hypothetical protein